MATKKKAVAAKKSPTKKSPAKKLAGKKLAGKSFSGKSFSGRKAAALRGPAGPKRGAAAEKKKKARLPKPAVPGKGRSPRRTAGPATPLVVEPAAAPSAAPAAAQDPARPTALMIAHAGLDKKAEDVTVLDVRGLTSYADYFVVMTADSDRQAGAIADHVEQTMKEKGVSKVGVEGYEGGRWILVDYGDVVAHVMNKESRGFYDLEGLWADAPRFSVEG
jgi:ribosome-associated protein